jgi:SAM-dependent methyltransferase
MSDDDIWAAIVAAARERLGDDTAAITQEMTAADIPGWDSLAHLHLGFNIGARSRTDIDIARTIRVTRLGDLVAILSPDGPSRTGPRTTPEISGAAPEEVFAIGRRVGARDTVDRQLLEATILGVLRRRLADMGEREGGLHRYYRVRVETNTLFAHCDTPIADLLRRGFGPFDRVWDIGCGVGQLAVLIAAERQNVVALDAEKGRYEALNDVVFNVDAVIPGTASRIETRHGYFPEALGDNDVSHDLAICFGLTFTANQEFYDRAARALRRFRAAVIDIACLFTHEPDRAKWADRARDFARLWDFETPTALYQYGAGQIFLFRPRPAVEAVQDRAGA